MACETSLTRCFTNWAASAGLVLATAACGENAPTAPTQTPTSSTPTSNQRLGTSQLNVAYCTSAGGPQALDMYYPLVGNATGRFPVIMYIHGGQYIMGNKNAAPGTPAGMWRPVATARGYMFVSINYRLGPTHKFPAMIEDAKCAVRYLRANAAALGIDADRIGVTGTSSGGTLAALIALADTSAGFDVGDFAGVSSRVRAAVIEYGADMNLAQPPFSAAENEERMQAMPQPMPPSLIAAGTVVNHVSSDDPPCFFIHGDHDAAVDAQDNVAINARLQAVGVPSSFQFVINGVHGWDAQPLGPISPPWPAILDMELAFFDRYLR